MADLPSISVILPTRSRPLFLAEAVRGVLGQRLPPDQLIVVDDSGRDEAAPVLEAVCGVGLAYPCQPGGRRYARPTESITLVRGPGRGPGAARNAGLRAAQGELVALLDDDDIWHPRKLELQAEWFVRRPALGLLGTGSYVWQEQAAAGALAAAAQGRGRAWACPPYSIGRIRPVSLSALVRANRLVTSSVMARRACLEGWGGFEESLALAQDWDLWLRVADDWEVAVLPAPLVFYRRHAEQRSADVMAMRSWEAEVLGRALARGLPGRWVAGVARRRLAWSHARLGRLLVGRGEFGRAREEFGAAMELFWCSPAAWAGLLRCAMGLLLRVGAHSGAPSADSCPPLHGRPGRPAVSHLPGARS